MIYRHGAGWYGAGYIGTIAIGVLNLNNLLGMNTVTEKNPVGPSV